MITKLATFRGVTSRGDPLVQVFRQGSSVTKVAGSLMPPIQDWLGTYKSDARKIAILVNAMGASEFWGQNVNGDIFPEGALIHDCRCHPGDQHPVDDFTGKVVPPYGYWTFLNAFPYVHHRNKDPTRAFGKVEVTCWNPRMHRVELIVLIDRHLAMQHDAQHIVDRIDRGDYPDVSMGCRVPYDICAVCGNKSKTRNDYCSCVKNIGMGKILDDGRQIGVINTYPRFFDISFVFIGADKTAKMMCKLGSAGVPQSVLDADRVYHFEETPDGIIKAACGRKAGCSECRGKCKVAEPRISGVSAEEYDRILAGLRGAAAGAVSGHTPAESAIRAATGAARLMGISKAMKDKPLKVKGVPKRLSQKREGELAKKLLKKISSEQTRLSAEIFSEGTGEPTRHKRLTREVEDGQSRTTIERLAPPPASSQTIYGREDHQDEEGAPRVLSTNEDTPTDGVEDDAKLSYAIKQASRITKYLRSVSPAKAEGTLAKLHRSAGTRPSLTSIKTPEAVERNIKSFRRSVKEAPVDYTPRGSPLWRDAMKDIKAGRLTQLESGVTRAQGRSIAKHGPSSPLGQFVHEENMPRLADHQLEVLDALRAKGGGIAAHRRVTGPGLYANPKGTPRTAEYAERAARTEGASGQPATLSFSLPQSLAGESKGIEYLVPREIYQKWARNVKLSSANFKMGPPPSPNREKYPFVGSINFRGLLIYVENAPNTWRTGTGWKTKMKVPYGEFARSLGTDGDKLDVYVGPHRDCENVFIVHQNHVYGPKKGEYDEDKVMLGFRTPAQAKAMYLAHYDSPKFFRSMTTMAFPLFKKALLRREVDGEKVASRRGEIMDFYLARARGENPPAPGGVDRRAEVMAHYTGAKEKTAESLKLEDLFDSATTEGTRRRERTWRDKTSGKETNVTGSGMGSWEKTKTASAPVYGPLDLYKLSMEDKEAAKRKWAEIIKQVGPSKAVGQTSPLLSASEPCIPRAALDAMGAKGLESALATPSLMGMVLKPREFQRISLVHMGKKDLADQLDDAGACFRPQMGEEGPCPSLEPHHADMDLLKMLLPLLSQRSYYGPVVKRRIIRITMVKPQQEPPEQEVDSPLLSKVSAAYNWYRREQMKVATSSLDKVASIPELHAGIYGIDDADLFKTATIGKPDKATMVAMLGAIPLTLMYSAHLRSEKERGGNVGSIGRFVADHPWLTSLAAVSGTRALMNTPAVRKHIDEGLNRAAGAAQALRGG